MFMTPLIFHAIDFSASEVGSGLAVSALIGTVVRLLCGTVLDRGVRCSWPIRITTLLAIAADVVLIQAESYSSYLLGQLMLGCAAGLYWPAIELAVPLSCGSVPSGRGYALVRSADALGIGIGALIGTLSATLGILRIIYVVEAVCMTAVLILISLYPLLDTRAQSSAIPRDEQQDPTQPKPTAILASAWLLPLLPVLGISVVATGILALQQSALTLISCVEACHARTQRKSQQRPDRPAIDFIGQPAVACRPLALGSQCSLGLGISLISFRLPAD